jgi:hypothetical protein
MAILAYLTVMKLSKQNKVTEETNAKTDKLARQKEHMYRSV